MLCESSTTLFIQLGKTWRILWVSPTCLLSGASLQNAGHRNMSIMRHEPSNVRDNGRIIVIVVYSGILAV